MMPAGCGLISGKSDGEGARHRKVGAVLPDPEGSNSSIDRFYNGIRRAVTDFGIVPTIVVWNDARYASD